jgi:hypothetical protein
MYLMAIYLQTYLMTVYLQMYLSIRYGSSMSLSMLHNIYLTLDKIKNFSDRLKIFLGEVRTVCERHTCQQTRIPKLIALCKYIVSNGFNSHLFQVTQVGLQRQYEPVCENLGLMAYLMQCEPCMDC